MAGEVVGLGVRVGTSRCPAKAYCPERLGMRDGAAVDGIDVGEPGVREGVDNIWVGEGVADAGGVKVGIVVGEIATAVCSSATALGRAFACSCRGRMKNTA